MTESIAVPIWVVAVAGVLVFWSVLDRLLIPSSRWFVRRRINRIVTELNTRLQFQIPAFKLTKRQVLLDRLTFDPKIMAAVDSEAHQTGAPRDALARQVERYAREIVPSFNAYFYFRIGHYLARRVAQSLYRVRLGYSDDESLSAIDPNASIVFVMNHRSNMDYLIVAYMAANRTALSYAVGEWARIWPLQTLIRSLGAYFVRRSSKNPLYRRVLARYVQMATESGVVQAMYPEGGLSRDGRLQPFKLGLVSYMVSACDPTSDRDLVFIPVGINYDRVLEDRSLVRMIDPGASQTSKRFIVTSFLKWIGHNFKLILRQRWYRFGYACVNFGTPISIRSYFEHRGIEPHALEPDARATVIASLGEDLLGAIARTIPVVPVSLIATVFVRRPAQAMSALEIKAHVQRLISELESRNAYTHIPRADRDYAITVGLRMLVLRHFVFESDGLYRAADGEESMLHYYANAIEHFLAPVR